MLNGSDKTITNNVKAGSLNYVSLNPETLIHNTSKTDTLKATSYMLAEQRFTESNDGCVEVAEQAASFLRRGEGVEELEVLIHGVCRRC